MKERGPWKIKSEELKYQTNWIAVSHHEVIDPKGNEGIYGVIHFKNIAVGMLPLDEQGNTWIVGQYRYPIGHYSWEIPEGGGRRDVPTLESAKRELKEETGIEAAQWTKILEMDLSNSASDEQAVVYLAQELSFGQSEPESTEDLQVRKMHFSELLDMVLKGEVRDAITVATVLKVELMIRDGSLTFQK
jgi:ADP-ribose pyrophosphatase